MRKVTNDGLGRRAGEASRWNGGGDGIGGSYRSAPEMDGVQLKLAVARHTASGAKEQGKVNVKQDEDGWITRWKSVLSIPAFKSRLTKILAQWEVVMRLGAITFIISSVIVGVLVVSPVP